MFRPAPPTAYDQRALGQRLAGSGHHSEAAALPLAMSYTRVAVLRSGGAVAIGARPGRQFGGGVPVAQWPGLQASRTPRACHAARL